jgi:hypothetical protein
MKFLFLVGVEGCGHHMVRAVMHRFLQQPNFVDQGKWHNVMVDFFDVEAWNSEPRSLFASFTRRNTALERTLQARERIQSILKECVSIGITHLFESASFPYGQPRNTLRRPDILFLAETLQGWVDLRMLVLYRNPIAASYSGFRRGFTENLLLQAKIIEDNLIFLNAQLGQCPKDIYKTLTFESFLANPRVYVEPLASWWQLDKQELGVGLEALRTPTSMDDIPKPDRDILETFFTLTRKQQWPLLYSEENDVLSWL